MSLKQAENPIKPKQLGLNIGFHSTKVTDLTRSVRYENIVGRRFQSLVNTFNHDGIVLTFPTDVAIGEQAIRFADAPIQQQDDNWLYSEEYYYLYLAALSEMTLSDEEVELCALLPYSLYALGKEYIQNKFQGAHKFQRAGRDRQTVTVTKMCVLPEAFAGGCDEALNDAGDVADVNLFRNPWGYIDIGGGQTNIVYALHLRDVAHKCVTLDDCGMWKVVDALRDLLAQSYQRTHIDRFLADDILKTGKMLHNGQQIDVSREVHQAKQTILPMILTTVNRLWPDIKGMYRIFIGGGGSFAVGDALVKHYPQACIAADRVFGNARGAAKFVRIP